jgi:hypothetical protein
MTFARISGQMIGNYHQETGLPSDDRSEHQIAVAQDEYRGKLLRNRQHAYVGRYLVLGPSNEIYYLKTGLAEECRALRWCCGAVVLWRRLLEIHKYCRLAPAIVPTVLYYLYSLYANSRLTSRKHHRPFSFKKICSVDRQSGIPQSHKDA